MVLGAIAKAAAKAGRKAANKAKNKVARARKAGDDAYNARRRYQRSAQRNLRKAEQSTGATAARYRQLAREDLSNAIDTYEQGTTQNFNKTISGLADRLGVDLQQQRRRMQSMREDTAQRVRSSAISEQKSSTRLIANMGDAEALRQAEARMILNSKAGHRIIGGLVDVWKEEATITTEDGMKVDNRKIIPALFDYFQVDNLADMLEKVEEMIGESLYADVDSDSMYEAVKITLQKHVVMNTIAA